MITYNMTEAKTHFPELMASVLLGEIVVINKAGKQNILFYPILNKDEEYKDTMRVYNMEEAKTHVADLMASLKSEKRIVIKKEGEPVAMLSSVGKGKGRSSVFGLLKGKLKIAPDF